MQEVIASFTPQIVVIAPDAEDGGLLQDEFILTYSLTGNVDDGQNTSLGTVSIQIPFAANTVSSLPTHDFILTHNTILIGG